MKRIYPVDWKRVHPKKMSTATDQYYTVVANKVLDAILESGMVSSFPDDECVRDAAIRMTAWFEDICSKLGFWRTFNEICRKRHGKPIPFYNAKDYIPGEPNLQDAKLLLWDILQTWHPDQIVNPENPGIAWTAMEILNIFDEEYKYAPKTDELVDYLSRPEIGTDYWKTREVMEWFSLSNYFSLCGQQRISEVLAARNAKKANPIITYAATWNHILTDRHNLLSLTAAEWISTTTGKSFCVDTSRLAYRYYSIEEQTDTGIVVSDLVSDDRFVVEDESFNARWYKELAQKNGLVLYCGFIEFNGKHYQCGALVTDPNREEMQKGMEEIRRNDHIKSLLKENVDLFHKASKGKSIVFIKGIDAVADFYAKGIGWVFTDEQRNHIIEVIDKQAEDGVVALMLTPDQGLLTITSRIPAIKARNNPYYDVEYAKDHAHNLLVDPDAIDYSAACILLKEGCLSDASFGSLLGYQHGHKLMRDNAQFILDYMFAEHQ